MASLASTFNQTTSESCCLQNSSILMAIPCSLLQLKHFRILFALMLHPYGNSCFSFQPNQFRILPWSSILPATFDSPCIRNSSTFCWLWMSILQTAPSISPSQTTPSLLQHLLQIFFKETIQSSAMILIYNHLFTFFDYLVNLSQYLPFKITF